MANIGYEDNNDLCVNVLFNKIGAKGLEVLLYMIKANKSLNMSAIRKGAELGSDTIYNAMMPLTQYRLVEEVEEVEGNQRIFKLTEKGARIAIFLKQADDELSKDA